MLLAAVGAGFELSQPGRSTRDALSSGEIVASEVALALIGVIEEDPNQPRKTFHPQSLEELARDIELVAAVAVGTLPDDESALLLLLRPRDLRSILLRLKEAILPDPNHDGAANPGEAIIYLVTLRNTGTAPALDAVFAAAVDPHTTLLNGTVSTTQGAVVLGNGETSIQVELGTLAGNAVATIEFTVIVDLSIPETLDQVSCQGELTGTNFARTLTDDPETAAPRDPTVTPVFEDEGARSSKCRRAVP